ncbi:MAG: OsmC family protein [Mariprofundaceae bacterium]|nr:OsmC family protein [Mariprofundaceae bacterium]
MRINVHHEGGAKFTARCRNHSISIDQPIDHDGEDTGMTPPEIMAASLASCIGFYIARYCQKAGLDSTGLQVGCDWLVGGTPRRIESFVIQVNAPHIPAKRQKAIAKVANTCLIHATLHAEPMVEVKVQVGE